MYCFNIVGYITQDTANNDGVLRISGESSGQQHFMEYCNVDILAHFSVRHIGPTVYISLLIRLRHALVSFQMPKSALMP